MFNRVKSLLALTVLATFGFASVATADETFVQAKAAISITTSLSLRARRRST